MTIRAVAAVYYVENGLPWLSITDADVPECIKRNAFWHAGVFDSADGQEVIAYRSRPSTACVEALGLSDHTWLQYDLRPCYHRSFAEGSTVHLAFEDSTGDVIAGVPLFDASSWSNEEFIDAACQAINELRAAEAEARRRRLEQEERRLRVFGDRGCPRAGELSTKRDSPAVFRAKILLRLIVSRQNEKDK
jgi:hypothetical protein